MLDYQSTQQKLVPIIANTYALHFAKQLLSDKYGQMRRAREARLAEEVHALSAGLKAHTTAYTAGGAGGGPRGGGREWGAGRRREGTRGGACMVVEGGVYDCTRDQQGSAGIGRDQRGSGDQQGSAGISGDQ